MNIHCSVMVDGMKNSDGMRDWKSLFRNLVFLARVRVYVLVAAGDSFYLP